MSKKIRSLAKNLFFAKIREKLIKFSAHLESNRYYTPKKTRDYFGVMYRLDTTTRFLKGPTVNYFDIDGLLASEEALEVRFLEETQELGWLEKNGSLEPNDPVCASKPTPDFKMPAGGEAKLPLWLVKLWEQEQLIEVTKGPYEADTVRGALEVNPLVFSMAQHPYFYEIGLFYSERFVSF